jgi:hypothetical protein
MLPIRLSVQVELRKPEEWRSSCTHEVGQRSRAASVGHERASSSNPWIEASIPSDAFSVSRGVDRSCELAARQESPYQLTDRGYVGLADSMSIATNCMSDHSSFTQPIKCLTQLVVADSSRDQQERSGPKGELDTDGTPIRVALVSIAYWHERSDLAAG